MDMSIEQRLIAAAAEGDVDCLYTLIQEDPHVLDTFDVIPFVDTPLHVAASHGHVQFAMEIVSLKPSFASKWNQFGWCPIHVALQNDQISMVRRFVEQNKNLVRVKGREGITPLHFITIAPDNDHDDTHSSLLKLFLDTCPDSINDVTSRNETALHVAVKHQKFDCLNILVRWLNTKTKPTELEETILNWKDDDGNTVLHIAASKGDTEATMLLIMSPINLEAKNLKSETASEIADDEDIKRILARSGARSPLPIRQLRLSCVDGITISWSTIFRSLLLSMNKWIIRKTRMRGCMSEDERNAYLVVATLVATATYQAALSPPGGLYQPDAGSTNDHTLSHSSSINWKPSIGNEGNSIMSDPDFILFTSTNMISFMASTFAIFGLLPRNVAWPLLFVPTFLLQLSYLFSMMVISPTRATTILVVCIFAILDGIFTVVGPMFIP